jgi:hypothetical protein
MIHEQEGNGPDAFWIDHFKPRSKGGRVKEVALLTLAKSGIMASISWRMTPVNYCPELPVANIMSRPCG